jgi:hypothetical protein
MSSNEEGRENNGRAKLIAAVVLLVVIVAAVAGAYVYINHKSSGELSVADDDGITEYKTGLSDLEPTDEIYASMAELNEAVDKYCDENIGSKGLVSEYGLMFDLSANSLVDFGTIVSAEYFENLSDLKDNVDILYIFPKDLGNVADKAIEGDTLTAMTALNTKYGYYVSGTGIEGVTLTQEQYNALLKMYSFNHGDRRNPEVGSDEYNAIMAATGFSEPYDVKHIDCDDKYAVVVVGSLNDASEVKQYMLINENDSWSVALDGLESKPNPRQTVNQKYPDMELELMPKYIIAAYGEILSGLDDYVSSVKGLGLLNDLDTSDGIYTCGVGKFVYMQSNSTGKRLLGHLDENNSLQFFEVDSLEEAVANMLELEDDPPVFILKFDRG